MEIHNHIRKLKAARSEAKKQDALARELSTEIAERVKAHVKRNGSTIATVSQRSGVPYPTLVNLFWGNMTHCLTGEEVMKVWEAATPTKDQKLSYTFQMRQLTKKDWEKSDKDIALRIGCCLAQVQRFRKTLKCKK
jgi:lambda repressor-like predicted transcriptional regulator